MDINSFLAEKLQKFSIIDISLVKAVYFLFGLLIATCYPKLLNQDWWWYCLLALLSTMPLYIQFFSYAGGLIDKINGYLKNNNPSNQVLLFLSVFFFALMVAILLPALTDVTWWFYLVLMILLATKPMHTTWFW